MASRSPKGLAEGWADCVLFRIAHLPLSNPRTLALSRPHPLRHGHHCQVLYDYWDGTVVDGHPCDAATAGPVPCCQPGALCVGDGLSFNWANSTEFSFYVGPCPAPRDQQRGASCRRDCATMAAPNAVYNATAAHWACCNASADGTRLCDRPTAETFDTPPPAALLA